MSDATVYTPAQLILAWRMRQEREVADALVAYRQHQHDDDVVLSLELAHRLADAVADYFDLKTTETTGDGQVFRETQTTPAVPGPDEKEPS
jgi:hypothetical protein